MIDVLLVIFTALLIPFSNTIGQFAFILESGIQFNFYEQNYGYESSKSDNKSASSALKRENEAKSSD